MMDKLINLLRFLAALTLATFRRKITGFDPVILGCERNLSDPGVSFSAPLNCFVGHRYSRLAGSLPGQVTADVDHVVGNHSQAHPALHPGEPSIPASV